MSGHEAALGMQWLFEVLSGDATLASLAPGGIWRSLAKPNILTPYVIIAYQSGNDVITENAYRIIADYVYQVKAVGPADIDDVVAQAAARIDQLIGGPTSGSTSGGLILSCNRQAPLFLDEIVNENELWTSIGGLHRIIIEQTP